MAFLSNNILRKGGDPKDKELRKSQHKQKLTIFCASALNYLQNIKQHMNRYKSVLIVRYSPNGTTMAELY